MKKKIGFSVLAIIVVSVFSLLILVKFGNGEKTVADLIDKEGSMQLKIIHEEKTDKGIMVPIGRTLEKKCLDYRYQFNR